MLQEIVKKRRSKMEIYLEILSVLQSGETKPTRIMTKTNMAWAQIQREFRDLEEKDLIEIEETPEPGFRKKKDKRSKLQYSLTRKGANVLRYYRKDAGELGELIQVMHGRKVK